MNIGQLITLKAIPVLLASISIYSSSTFAQSQTNLPTRMIYSEEGKQVLLPDWQRISFNNMPAIQESGSIKANGLSREWNAGDTPDRYLTLGDIDEALKPQLFSLSNITSVSNDYNLNASTLEDFPLLGEQIIRHLAEVVPNLGQTNTEKIPPITALLRTESPQASTNTTLSNLLSQNHTLGKLKLNQIDLSAYTISDIPNLDAVQLSNFKGWENTLIKDVPQLNAVPLASFPLPLTEAGNKVARIDFRKGSC